MLVVVILSSLVIAQAANIDLLNNWLHHEMEPIELHHHFGVDSPAQVNPQLYQVIQIHIDSDKFQEPEHIFDVQKRTGSATASQAIKYKAFGFQNNILLERNEKLLSSAAQLFFVDNNSTEEGQMPENTDCHYLHNSKNMTAALSKLNLLLNITHYYDKT